MRDSKISRFTSLLLVSCAVPSLAFAQTSISDTTEVDRKQLLEAVTSAQNGEQLNAYQLELIAKFHHAELVQPLALQFGAATDHALKGKLANVLVRLDASDPRFWQYLSSQVEAILASDAPDRFKLNAQGYAYTAEPSDAYVAWAKTHHLDLQTALELTAITEEADVMELATTGDPRAVPYLLRLLHARSFLFILTAENGLLYTDRSQPKVTIHHDHLSEVIARCKEGPNQLRFDTTRMLDRTAIASGDEEALLASKSCKATITSPAPRTFEQAAP